jgi:hypothetical protein
MLIKSNNFCSEPLRFDCIVRLPKKIQCRHVASNSYSLINKPKAEATIL